MRPVDPGLCRCGERGGGVWNSRRLVGWRGQ